jgi:sarcosine oxidase subunit beta
VSTSAGEVGAGNVVNAAGAWSAEIGRMVDLQIPVVPRRGQMFVTQAIAPSLRRGLYAAESVVGRLDPVTLRLNNAPPRPGSEEHDRELWGRQAPNGHIHFGGKYEYVGFDKRVTRDGIGSLVRRLCVVVPPFRDLTLIRMWAGLMPVSADGVQILGGVPGLHGFYIATGHGGGGFSTGPGTGALMADLITRGATEVPLDGVTLSRFWRLPHSAGERAQDVP